MRSALQGNELTQFSKTQNKNNLTVQYVLSIMMNQPQGLCRC